MDSATSTDFCKSSLSLGSWFWLSGFDGTCQCHGTHTAVTYGGFNCCGSNPQECTAVWTRLLGAERAPNLLFLATELMSPGILGGLSQQHWHGTEKIYWKEALEENDKYSHSQKLFQAKCAFSCYTCLFSSWKPYRQHFWFFQNYANLSCITDL